MRLIQKLFVLQRSCYLDCCCLADVVFTWKRQQPYDRVMEQPRTYAKGYYVEADIG